MPSVIQARRAVALSAIAGLGVSRPPASTPSAKRLTGSDVTGVSYRVRAEHGLTTASLAAGAARAALRGAGIDTSDLQIVIVGTTTPGVLWPPTARPGQTQLHIPVGATFHLYA